MDMERQEQELQKRDAFLKAQEEYQRQQQAHQEYINAQQMAAIQPMFQQQGLTFVMSEQSGHTDFVNNLFASGGSGHNSNDSSAI
ncbi:hypothetical protein U9M48_031716 [Paspalum notatum var. saurae]|uniref:Uncharacterized protein n=1 Tax=Paspalum notatum var. saurae TaxID=547442 RepID=A0AAQ3U4I7_PASNO